MLSWLAGAEVSSKKGRSSEVLLWKSSDEEFEVAVCVVGDFWCGKLMGGVCIDILLDEMIDAAFARMWVGEALALFLPSSW